MCDIYFKDHMSGVPGPAWIWLLSHKSGRQRTRRFEAQKVRRMALSGKAAGPPLIPPDILCGHREKKTGAAKAAKAAKQKHASDEAFILEAAGDSDRSPKEPAAVPAEPSPKDDPGPVIVESPSSPEASARGKVEFMTGGNHFGLKMVLGLSQARRCTTTWRLRRLHPTVVIADRVTVIVQRWLMDSSCPGASSYWLGSARETTLQSSTVTANMEEYDYDSMPLHLRVPSSGCGDIYAFPESAWMQGFMGAGSS